MKEFMEGLTFASPATALASNVLPVPGEPNRRIPFGILAPISTYFLGFFKKSTTSSSSCFSSSQPATSLNVTVLSFASLALDLAKSNALLFPPPLDNALNKMKKIMIVQTSGRRLIIILKTFVLLTV